MAGSTPTASPFPYEPTAVLSPSGTHEALRRFVYPDGHVGWIVGSHEHAVGHPHRLAVHENRRQGVAQLGQQPDMVGVLTTQPG